MTSEVLPAFSIIVPVYNGGDVIERCINSVLEQNYKTFELIIIDDGSVDQTQKVCHEYQLKDKRIKYHKQANKGVSAARNNGLKAARNEYVLFVDADDYLLPSFLDSFANTLKGVDLDSKLFIFQDFIAKIKFTDQNGRIF